MLQPVSAVGWATTEIPGWIPGMLFSGASVTARLRGTVFPEDTGPRSPRAFRGVLREYRMYETALGVQPMWLGNFFHPEYREGEFPPFKLYLNLCQHEAWQHALRWIERHSSIKDAAVARRLLSQRKRQIQDAEWIGLTAYRTFTRAQ